MAAVTPLAWVLLLAATPAELDAQPLPRYLGRAEVAAALDAVMPALQACLPGPGEGADLVALDFTVARSGAVTPGAAVAPGDAACWRAAVASIDLPPHDEDPLAVAARLPVHAGRLLAPVRLDWPEADTVPLLFYLPPDIPASTRREAVRALGLPVPPGGGDPAPQ